MRAQNTRIHTIMQLSIILHTVEEHVPWFPFAGDATGRLA